MDRTVEYAPRKVKNMILRRGLTPVDVAARSGGRVGKSAVYNIIKGQYGKTLAAKLEAVARALSVPLEDLLRDDSSERK